LDRDLR